MSAFLLSSKVRGNRCALFSQQGNGDIGPPAAKELNSVNKEIELGGESQAPEENTGCWHLEFGFMRPLSGEPCHAILDFRSTKL